MKIHALFTRPVAVDKKQWLPALFLLSTGLWLIGNSTYIHAKAVLAQLLLETAWTESRCQQGQVKPWPWADTWPVARLSAPRLDIDHIVLAGASGATLAFGPGHLFNSAAPGQSGNVIISGHRDTHFAFLEKLKKGDALILESTDKQLRRYIVSDQIVIDKNKQPFIDHSYKDQLTLITCYPFNAIRAGGPLRYIIIAKPVPVLMT